MYFRLHARHAAKEMGDNNKEVLKLFLRHVSCTFLLNAYYTNIVIGRRGGDGRRRRSGFLRVSRVHRSHASTYEYPDRHTVVPLNFRIAATARLIGSEHH